MRIRLLGAVTAASIAFVAVPTAAQERFAVELRGGIDAPTREIGTDELGAGFGFDATVRYSFMPHLAAYAGWDWIHFNPATSFAGADMDFEETGYAFGLRFEHPFKGESGGLAYWLRGGATYDHLEIENQDGDMVADSGHGWGWEAAAGVAFDVSPRLSLTPGLRYRALSRDVEIGTTTTEVDLQYVAAEMGLALRF